jgi:hypothetical protein
MSQMSVRRMRISRREPKATHSEYVTLIPFVQQKWLHVRASMLRLYVFFYFKKVNLMMTF